MNEESGRGERPENAGGNGAAGGRRAPLVVVMGVSGSGKTTVGAMLADRLGVRYAEADSFHPPANIRKMSAGTPLDDEDRRPWLDAIAGWLSEHAVSGGVVSCSALRRRYRDRLRASGAPMFFVHLDGSEELVAERLEGRKGHFMPRSLLRSQFAALEPLEPDEPGAVIPVGGSPQEVTERALAALAP